MHYPLADVFAISTGSSEDLFLRATDMGDETVFEIVATPSTNISDFDFTLTGSDGITLSDFIVDTDVTAALGSSGTLTETSATKLSFSLMATSGSLSGSTEHILGTFKASGQGMLTVSEGDVGTSTIPALTYEIHKTTTGTSGAYELSFNNGDAIQLSVDADYVIPSRNPLTPTDALGVLKTVVGMNLSPSAEELIAGDVNQDGKLTPSDALRILKNVVGMSGGADPEWVFIDENADYTSMNAQSVNYSEIIEIASLTTDTTLNLDGILIGDYNGTL